ncbi:MAG: hypothetical protein KAW40_00345 [Candidatus Aenigmarchaeota archaeon]|nr:hypothetical protein [Candidatus Aenigmarchaeota archaeon]
MIKIIDSDISGYEKRMKNYNQDFYLDSKGRWYDTSNMSVGTGENQLLTNLYQVVTLKKPCEKRGEKLEMLEVIIRNIMNNRRISLNGISYLPRDKLQEIMEAINDDCPYFWRMNYKKESYRTIKKDIKQALNGI